MDVKKLYGRDIDTCKSCDSYKDDICLKNKKNFSSKDYRLCDKWKYRDKKVCGNEEEK